MKQKLLKAQTELREAYTMARANRSELALANRVQDALSAVSDSILTLEVLENGGHYAN